VRNKIGMPLREPDVTFPKDGCLLDETLIWVREGIIGEVRNETLFVEKCNDIVDKVECIARADTGRSEIAKSFLADIIILDLIAEQALLGGE